MNIITPVHIAALDDTGKAVASEVQNHVAESFHFLDWATNFLIAKGPDILVAVLILLVGAYVSRFLRKMTITMLSKGNYDQTIRIFSSQLVYYAIMFLFILSALSRLGVPSSSFVAAVGAIGLAIGLALQNDLANFASGLIILVFKPFRVGDVVQVTGSADIVGSVSKIELFYTTIINKENRAIFVPNAKLTSGSITNITHFPERLMKFDIGIAYDSSHHEAMKILNEIFNDSEYVLNKGYIEMGITAFGDNAVTITAYPRVSNDNFLALYYYTMSEVKDRFDAAGIGIPFPQRDVYHHFPKGIPSVVADHLAVAPKEEMDKTNKN